ncbi:MAG: hypothetical protein K6G71_06205, partial [Clostridiales bacterium]|nr:hypothetical protein [Clostridiales bacterium]
ASYIDKIGKYDSDYYKKRKSVILKGEIASLEQTIEKTEPFTSLNLPCLFSGIVGTIVGITFFILGVWSESVLATLFAIVSLFVGIGFIWLATSKKERGKNIEEVEKAKKSLAEKQDELRSLNK